MLRMNGDRDEGLRVNEDKVTLDGTIFHEVICGAILVRHGDRD